MTKKDYRIIAIAFAQFHTDGMPAKDARKGVAPEDAALVKSALIDRICVALKVDNPRFNEEKFREACGV